MPTPQPRSARAREAVNVSIDPELLAEARALGIPISATLTEALRARVLESRRAAWLAENADAILAYNERIEREGVWSDGLRRF